MLILKKYFNSLLPFKEEELLVLEKYFYKKNFSKKDFILKEGKVCDFIAFIENGFVRHFHYKGYTEITCDFSSAQTFITDMQSFNSLKPTTYNFIAMEETVCYLINKNNLVQLYLENSKFETCGRIIAEKTLERITLMAQNLLTNTPEERYKNFLVNYPDLPQRIPSKHIASFLGITPEGFSRMKNRMSRKIKST